MFHRFRMQIAHRATEQPADYPVSGRAGARKIHVIIADTLLITITIILVVLCIDKQKAFSQYARENTPYRLCVNYDTSTLQLGVSA